MFKKLIPILMLTALLGFASRPTKADTITQGGVSYTVTAGEVDGGGVFDVDLTIDASKATSSGSLSAFSIQFTGATNVAIESVFNGTTDITNQWTAPGQGTSTGQGTCNINGSANHWCTQTTSPISVPDSSKINFVFDVTMPAGTPLPTQSDIQAFQGQGGLAISNGVGIGTAVPEPSSAALLGVGLFGLIGFGFVRRKVTP